VRRPTSKRDDAPSDKVGHRPHKERVPDSPVRVVPRDKARSGGSPANDALDVIPNPYHN
jgi:hypothetical protein